MTIPHPSFRAFGVFVALLPVLIVAQTAPQPGAPTTPPRTVPATAEVTKPGAPAPTGADDTVVLSPFEVRNEDDQGYLATSAQSGTRLRSELKDIAASVSVVTKDFMNDIGARNLDELLTYTLNTEVGGVSGNFSEAVSTVVSNGTEMSFDGALGSVSPGTRVRGLTSADSTRDFFIADVPLDSYNVDRVEISRGPNAMLFGLGSPAGIINSSLILADLRRQKTRLEYRTDQYGSYRGALDHNQVLIKDRLALRLATVYDKAFFKVQPAYYETKRAFLTATWRPFKNTTIKASTELARQDSNRPRINAPYDAYTWWWQVGKPVYNPSTSTLTLLSTPTLVSAATATGGRNSNVIITAVGPLGGTNHMGLFYSDPNSSVLGIPGTNVVGFRSGQIPNVHLNAAGTALVTDGWMALADPARILNAVIHASATDPTRNFWRNIQITDPSIYDFYRHMLDGPNKYEWARWNTYNVTLEQRLFDGRGGFELAANRQNLDNGAVLPYTSQSAYSLRLDINSTLPDGRANPNFGRPLVVGFQSANVGAVDRDAARATAYYNLDLTDIAPRTAWFGQVLGRHLITGTHTRLRNQNESYGAAFAFNSDVKYAIDNQGSLQDASTQGRDVSIVHYIGPSVLGSATPVGGIVTPTGQWPDQVKNVNILWYTSPATTTPPPNKWEERTYGLISNGRYNVDNTRRASGIRRTRTEINSTSFVSQDRFFNGKLVGTVGWRRDDVYNYDAGTAVRDPVTGVGINDPATLFPKRISSISQNTFSWGVVGHSPDFIQRRLPFGSELSLTFNKADNFRPAGQRYSLYDVPLGPEVGETKEYGLLLSTFNGRLVLRAGHYKTSAAKSSSLVNLGTPLQALADGLDRVTDQNLRGQNANNPAGLAAYNAWVASPEGAQLYKTFRITTTGNTVNYDRRTGQVVGTADVVSEGTEYEVIFNPTRAWRIAFNAGKAEAIRSNTGLDLQALVATIAQLIKGPAGALRQEDNGTTFGNSMQANVIVPMLQVTTQDGSPTSELRKWHWNVITNYSFNEGRLKGWKLGGAARWQDEIAIGFPVIVDPVAGAIPNVKHPFFGPEEVNYDAWIGYSRRLRGDRVNWTVQLNLKNLGVQDKLIPVSAQPDGSINAYRIAEAFKWTLTNTFTF